MMRSVSDSDSDGSFLESQPASPISLSPNDSGLQLDNEGDSLQRRLIRDDINSNAVGAAVFERRHPRRHDEDTKSSSKYNPNVLGAGEMRTFDLSKYDVDEPFRYDAVIATAFVPTFCLALGFVDGEHFLLLLGAGCGISRLLLDAGFEIRAFVVATFFLQFSLLFSALPLIWTSVSYFFLLIFFNAFAVLSASWIFLHFRCFRRFDAELTIVLEKVLFAAFPSTALAIQSWMFVNFTATPAFLPYFLLVVGFV